MKRSLTIAAALIGMMGVAHAQQTVPPVQDLMAADDQMMTIDTLGVTVQQIDTMDVYDAAGQQIGSIENVLIDSQGNAHAVAAEVGQFLGVGERQVVIPLDQLRMEGDRLVTDLGQADLEGFETWTQ